MWGNGRGLDKNKKNYFARHLFSRPKFSRFFIGRENKGPALKKAFTVLLIPLDDSDKMLATAEACDFKPMLWLRGHFSILRQRKLITVS